MIVRGDCVERMTELDAGSVDAVVTDPPYGLEFMGKEWDRLSGQPGYVERGRITHRPGAMSARTGAGGRGVNSYQAGRPMQDWHERWAREALRVLKPGGHLLAFGGTRTYHRLACALEDAGFEIRDCICWLYGTGFPKSRDVGDGWGTALKPAHEPIVVARKPLPGTVAANVAEHGTGAINVDGCRIGFRDEADELEAKGKNRHADFGSGARENRVYGKDERARADYDAPGRWPANVVLDETVAVMLDEQTGDLAPGNHPATRNGRPEEKVYGSGWSSGTLDERRPTESGGASRFFYCAKASRAERGAGLDAANAHPTVKPVALMRWLVRLVTPAGGLVLDPFAGSGTTGIACELEGFRFVGIERDAEYAAIADARIGYWTTVAATAAAAPEQLDLLGGVAA